MNFFTQDSLVMLTIVYLSFKCSEVMQVAWGKCPEAAYDEVYELGDLPEDHLETLIALIEKGSATVTRHGSYLTIECADKDQKEQVRKYIKGIIRGLALANQAPCPQCPNSVGVSRFCADCGRELQFSQNERIQAIRQYIADNAPRARRVCSCVHRLCFIADCQDKPSSEKHLVWLSLSLPGVYNMRKALQSAFNRPLQLGTSAESRYDEYVSLPESSKYLRNLQSNLNEPVFIFGANCEAIFTATQMESILPALAQFREKYGSWYNPVLAISRDYPNIYCAICILDLHWDHIN